MMNVYIDDYVAALQVTTTFTAAGNGAFIHSCHTHCNGISGGWSGYKIAGESMGDVARAWWESDGTDTASKHTKLPCRYNAQSMPRQCNPTCPQ
jgi:STAM-binding protein